MKITRLILLLIAILAAVGGRALMHIHHPRPVNPVAFETDLTQGLVQGIIKELDADGPKVYFLTFGEIWAEPSPDFIARFAGHFPPVRGFESSVHTPNGLILDTASGQPGVIIQILRFKPVIPGTCDVWVTFPNRPAGPKQFTYRMFDYAGAWTIKSRLPS
jgi:hypothetical protein